MAFDGLRIGFYDVEVIVAALITLFFYAKAKRLLWLFILLRLPSTLLHESLHFIVAFLLNGRPCFPSVIPKRDGPRLILGYVRIRNVTWYNGGPIGLAPLSSLTLLQWALLIDVGVFTPLVSGFLVALIVMSGTPSIEDLRIAAKSSFIYILLFIGFIGYLL